jgi:uncharacterized integral membrane protein
MLRTKFILLLLLIMALAMLFVILNPQTVGVELAFVHWQLTLGLALLIALAAGIVIGMLIRGAWVAELLNERGRLRRALKAAEAKARSDASRELETPGR